MSEKVVKKDGFTEEEWKKINAVKKEKERVLIQSGNYYNIPQASLCHYRRFSG